MDNGKKKLTPYVVAVDFDDTITVQSKYPCTGELNIVAKQSLVKMHRANVKIIIWTSRTGKHLREAKKLIKKWSVPHDAINRNVLRVRSRKVLADYYIDDRASTSGNISWENVTAYVIKQAKNKEKQKR